MPQIIQGEFLIFTIPPPLFSRKSPKKDILVEIDDNSTYLLYFSYSPAILHLFSKSTTKILAQSKSLLL